MGVYDELVIDRKWLPEGKQVPENEQRFQTKSFDCQLALFEIQNDGRLIQCTRRLKNWEIEEVFDLSNYTGEIYFYDDDNEYKAWCENGVVFKVIDLNNTNMSTARKCPHEDS